MATTATTARGVPVAKAQTPIGLAVLATLLAVSASLFIHYESLPFLIPLVVGAGFGYLCASYFLARYQPTRYGRSLAFLCVCFLVRWSVWRGD